MTKSFYKTVLKCPKCKRLTFHLRLSTKERMCKECYHSYIPKDMK